MCLPSWCSCSPARFSTSFLDFLVDSKWCAERIENKLSSSKLLGGDIPTCAGFLDASLSSLFLIFDTAYVFANPFSGPRLSEIYEPEFLESKLCLRALGFCLCFASRVERFGDDCCLLGGVLGLAERPYASFL